MEPIKFKEMTDILAKGQPQYRALPIAIMHTDTPGVLQYTSKYQLSEMELAQIKATGCIYFSQFGNCFHPIRPELESPFLRAPILYKIIADEPESYFKAWIALDTGETAEVHAGSADQLINEILAYFPTGLSADIIQFIEKRNSGIDEHGNIIDL